VQGGQDYFRFVEGTCINCLCLLLSLALLFLSAAHSDSDLCSDSDPFQTLILRTVLIFREKETFLKTQFNPPFLCFSHLQSGGGPLI